MRFFEILLEYKRDVTKQQLGDRLAAAAQRDRQQDIDSVLSELEAMDPTTNKQYVLWLANQYIKGLFRLEDKPRVKDVLEKFINARSRLPEKDIGRYTFHSLEDEMDKIYNVDLKPQQTADKSAEQPQTFEVPKNVKVLYNGPLGLLAIPETKKASCELGSGTRWCTAGREDNMFTEYNKEAPLYIWRDKNGDKYQFHFGKYDFQFMDSKDRPIKKELLDQFRNQHPVLKQLFKEKEAEMAVSNRNMDTMDTLIRYARDVIKGRWPEIEARIVRNPELAYDYARDVIKGRWPEAEKVIVNYPYWAYFYAKEVIKKRWPEAEARIARNPEWAREYAEHVIKKKWPEAEKYIARNAQASYRYAVDVLKDRFPEAEKTIASNLDTAYRYAESVIQDRWPPAEKIILSDKKDNNIFYALRYAENVLKDRFPRAERIIASDKDTAYEYARAVIKGRFPAGEAQILRDPETAFNYAKYVIKGRWPEAEKIIQKDWRYWEDYSRFLARQARKNNENTPKKKAKKTAKKKESKK